MSATYLQTLRGSLPAQYQVEVDEWCKSQPKEISSLLESLIRFISGGDPPASSSAETRGEWKLKQSTARIALDALNPTKDSKRAREDDEAQPESGTKRRKLPGQEGFTIIDDPPLFRLHSISATSPVRKKVDITIHKLSIKFTHPSSNAIEATVPLSSVRRSFILPTRGKQKPHWTIVLMSSDTPEHGKSASVSVTQSNPQIIFGLDAITSTSVATTTFESSEPTTINLPKGSETLTYIRKFLSYVGSSVLQPTPEVFRSACGGNSTTSASTGGVPGVEAYRAAKPGSLWFMKEGILWGESKPCEFWAVGDLLGKARGLRMLSATGRTCSVILMRKSGDTVDEDTDDEDLGIETEFSMVDGREQEGINKWVRQHHHLFGKQTSQDVQEASATQARGSRIKTSSTGEAMTLNAAQLDESDASDESFGVDSDDGDGNSSTSSDSSETDESGAGSGMESEEGEETDNSIDEKDGDDLRPEHHPLMRPGAMPRMSRAAIDAVVGMVNDDLLGSGASDGEDELLDD